MEGLQQANDALPRRVCHYDTKFDDVLFYASVDVVALVEIDTVRPEIITSEFDDLVNLPAPEAAVLSNGFD